MKKLAVCLSLLLLVIVAGCTLVPTPTETPTSLPSATQAPTATATLAAPTATLAEKTPAQSPTIFFKETPASLPTIVATIVALEQPKISISSRSPNGEWRADLTVYDCTKVGDGDEVAYDQINMVHLTDMSAVVVDFQVKSCEGFGARGLGPEFWSNNSRYFYYTTAIAGRPDGCGYWQHPIYRFDVTSQTKEFIGAGTLSHDESKLAVWQHENLVVWDVNDGELMRIPGLAEVEKGPIAWGPESQTLVYLQFDSYCPLSGKSYVGYIDLSTGENTILLESEDPTFGDVHWVDIDKFALVDADRKEYTYDLETRQLVP